jgi:flagellar protein FliS
MSYGYPRSASAMYQQNAVHGRVEDADPHQLTMLLMDTAIERINQARNHLARGDLGGKAISVSKAMAIVVELRASLDHAKDSKLSGRLEALYEYVGRRLLAAQAHNDDAALAESARLLSPIRDSWREIRGQYLASVQAGTA